MSSNVTITCPTNDGSVNTSNGTVQGKYSTAVFFGSHGGDPPPPPPPPNTPVYKVKVMVGAQGPYLTDPLPASTPPADWTLTITSLTAAEDVTVTAQLVDTANATNIGEPDSVGHISVNALCFGCVTVGGLTPLPNSALAAVAGGPSAAKSEGCDACDRLPGRHKTVYYPYRDNPDLHRMMAIVIRKEIFQEEVGGATVRVVVKTVWAAVEALMQGGRATAIIPIPPAPTATEMYECYFAHFRSTTNALWFNTPATPL